MKRLTTIVILSAGLMGSPAMAGDNRGLPTAEHIAGAVGGYVVDRDIDHNYYGGRRYTPERRTYGSERRHYRDDDHRYRHGRRLHRIDKPFRARTTSNVRSGPGTRYRVIDRLHDHERVHVIGKVRGRNWYMVRSGRRPGFVYAPLLRPDYRGYGYRGHKRWGHRHHDRPWGGWHR